MCICRINTNAEAVVLRGDIARHGFRAGPTLTFPRSGHPTRAQIYFSTVFPFFFVSTSLQPTPNRSRAGTSDPPTDKSTPTSADFAVTPAVSEAPTSTHALVRSVDVGPEPSSVAVACFDAEDLLHVMHAVVKELADQDTRDADAIARATRDTHADDVGLEVTMVPIPVGAPQKVYEVGTGDTDDGFSAEDLEKASRQRSADCRTPRQRCIIWPPAPAVD